MKPVNSKSLLSFVFGQMEKLDSGQIDNDTAKSQAALIKQANNLLNYELNRSKVLMQLSAHNAIYKDGTNLRDIESKNFDSIE